MMCARCLQRRGTQTPSWKTGRLPQASFTREAVLFTTYGRSKTSSVRPRFYGGDWGLGAGARSESRAQGPRGCSIAIGQFVWRQRPIAAGRHLRPRRHHRFSSIRRQWKFHYPVAAVGTPSSTAACAAEMGSSTLATCATRVSKRCDPAEYWRGSDLQGGFCTVMRAAGSSDYGEAAPQGSPVLVWQTKAFIPRIGPQDLAVWQGHAASVLRCHARSSRHARLRSCSAPGVGQARFDKEEWKCDGNDSRRLFMAGSRPRDGRRNRRRFSGRHGTRQRAAYAPVWTRRAARSGMRSP